MVISKAVVFLRRKRLQLNLFQLKGCQNFWLQKIALICGAFRKTEVCSSIAGCFHPSEVDRFTDLYRCPYGCGKVLDSFLAPWYRDLEGMVYSCGVPGFLQISICLKKWLIWAAWREGDLGTFGEAYPLSFRKCTQSYTISNADGWWWFRKRWLPLGMPSKMHECLADVSKSHGFEAQYYVKHGVSMIVPAEFPKYCTMVGKWCFYDVSFYLRGCWFMFHTWIYSRFLFKTSDWRFQDIGWLSTVSTQFLGIAVIALSHNAAGVSYEICRRRWQLMLYATWDPKNTVEISQVGAGSDIFCCSQMVILFRK